MAVSNTLDHARRLVISMASGELTAADFSATKDALRRDPAFDPTYDQLFDLSAADLAGLTANDIQQMAADRLFGPASRRAIVVSGTVNYGLARMFQLTEGQGQIEVFTDRREAEAWLGANPSTG